MSDLISQREILSVLYKNCFGCFPEVVESLVGAGSSRRYFRLSSVKGRVIGVIASVSEGKAFVATASALASVGVRVPEVYAVSEDTSCYILQDLGDIQLYDLLKNADIDELVKKTMLSLARMQTSMPYDIEPFTGLRPFGKRLVRWDLNYFKYCFLKPAGVDFSEQKLQDDFDRLEQMLLSIPDSLIGFMYRDCQSRNVMIVDGEPWWIDFQGAMTGPCVYDIVSFLWQAKAGFSNSFREKMLEIYADEYCRCRSCVKKADLLEMIPYFVLFRTLQVLGAYGFRGLMERKAHFIESIPFAIRNLASIFDEKKMAEAYPAISAISSQLLSLERFNTDTDISRGLTVEVISFSYKKGYPENFTGNGGGFMFDCRALHNPGRYEEYSNLTGMDRPVIDFLNSTHGVKDFLENAYSLVKPAVNVYKKRGFTHLQIGFGCTGGRHRSVYSANNLAERLKRDFPDLKIRLIHREQGLDNYI